MHITPENDGEREKVFSSREVGNYFGYIEGDYEASLGKIIKTLIVANQSYIVYLDENDYVEWSYNEHFTGAVNFQTRFGTTINKIGFLEECSEGVLKDAQKSAFRRLLGESMARLLREQNEENAQSILNTAEQVLNSKCRQTLILSSLRAVIHILIINLLLWIFYCNSIYFPDWCKNLIPLAFCSLAGGVGGFIFLMLRSKKLEIEPALDLATYKWEGRLRIIYGVISGMVTYLALNGKLVLGNLENPSFSFTTVLICITSGVSEKIIPGIIKKIDGKF